MKNVMLDLETLGTRPVSPILVIGACRFGPKAEGVGEIFSARVSLEHNLDTGAIVDGKTFEWWLRQNDESRLALIEGSPALPLLPALLELKNFIGDRVVWGNGVGFDNAMATEAACRVYGEPLWEFWKDRCYRTLKSLFPLPDEKLPTRMGLHIAHEDAVYQAQVLMEMDDHYGWGVLA